MKLVINTQTNAIVGSVDGVAEALPDTVYLDPPEGFDMELATEWYFSGGILTHDPIISINRAKTARKARIKTEAAELIAASDWKLQRAKERESAGWSTLADVDALLTERESVRRSSGAAELELDALTDVDSIQGFTWSVNVHVIAPRRLTHTQFVGRFTDEELQAILAATQTIPAMGAWWKKFELADVVDMNDPSVQVGLQVLEFAGYIGEGRALEILI